MSVAVVTGSSGLIGSECVRYFAARGLDVVGCSLEANPGVAGYRAHVEALLHLRQDSRVGRRKLRRLDGVVKVNGFFRHRITCIGDPAPFRDGGRRISFSGVLREWGARTDVELHRDG